MSPGLFFPKNKRRNGFAIMLALALILPLASTAQTSGSQAFAQSEEAVITARAGYATFSYGLLSVSVTVENVTPGIDTVNIKYYNPDGGFEGELDGQLYIDNGTGGFHCYCFGVERKYVEDNYSLVVTYGDKTETFLVPPFSSQFPQPPDISASDLRIYGDGRVGTSGHVWGGMASENLTISILSADNTVISSIVARLGLHAQFGELVDTSGQLQVGSNYRITYHLEGTDVTEEKDFTFTGTDQALLHVDTEIKTGEFSYRSVGAQVVLYDQDRNELQRGTAPAEFMLTTGQQYFVEPTDSDDYVFSSWLDDGSTERVRSVSITYTDYMSAQYRSAGEPAPTDFSISLDPGSVETQLGGSGSASAKIVVTSHGGFSSEVTLDTSSYGATIDDTTITPPPDGSAEATISVPSSAFDRPGTYQVPLSAKSGSTYRYASLAVVVTETGTAGEPSVTVRSVDIGNANSEIYGFYTTLSQNGAVVSTGFTPVTFDLTSGQTYKILVYDYGSYYFNHWVDNASPVRERTITATGGETLLTAGYGTSPSAGEDFTISADSPMSVQAGSSGMSAVTVTSVNGLNSAVTLSASSDTPGITGSFDANPVVPPPDDSAASTLTVSVDASVPAGNYNLVVTGTTSSGITRSATVSLAASGDQPPSSGESSVTVRSVDSGTNSPINGYYTILYDSSGNAVQTGFTPATFDLTSGQQYTIEVQDYGSYYFNYWQDDGSTGRDRAFTASSPQTLTAVYSTSPSASPPPDDNNNEEQPPQQTTGTISVTTTDSSGNQIYGYYTTLSENGNVIQTAFSPAQFSVQSGQTYQIAVADYGQYVFDHWSDGSADRQHSAVAGDSLIAVYRP